MRRVAAEERPALRSDGRAPGELRPIAIEPGFVRTATGSALIAAGGTRVICTASAVDDVPRWMKGQGRGWVTAEYSMLPASTGERKQRDVSRGRPDGRTVEIQRLIGRSIRGVVDFAGLGERTVYLDCDVLEADGGTRCAAITGAYVALHLALARLVAGGGLAGLAPPPSGPPGARGVGGGGPRPRPAHPPGRPAGVGLDVGRARGARGPARGALCALRRRARHRRGQPREAAARGARRRRRARRLRVRARPRRAGRDGSRVRGPLRGGARAAAARRGGLRVRPGVRARGP